MESTWIIVAAVAGIAALVGWLSRNSLAGRVEALLAELEKAKAEAASARKEADRRAEEGKERVAELTDGRDKLREARRKLHEVQDEAKKLRELANARAQEVQEAEERLALLREDNARLQEDLRHQAQTAARTPPKKREEPAPVDPEAIVDERLRAMAKEVAEARRLQETAEARAEEARKKEAVARKQAEDARDELRRNKGRAEANHRVYLVAKGEGELWKARFSTLEQKWNDLWRELEGIGWKPREPAASAAAGAPAGEDRNRRRRPPRRKGRGPGGDESTVAAEDEVRIAAEEVDLPVAVAAVAETEAPAEDLAAVSKDGAPPKVAEA